MTATIRFPRLAVLGAGGLLGAEIVRIAKAHGWTVAAARSSDVDARNEVDVFKWLLETQPAVLVLVAAKTAGVHANIAAPADMLADNARIAVASIGAARRAGVPRLIYCSSTAIYSETAPQPYREADAGAGVLEQSHMGYSAAKLLGTRYCQAIRAQDGLDYTAALIANIYGPGQSYDPARSNVAGSLLARFHQAKVTSGPQVTIWGTGAAKRDLIYVEDAANALLLLAEQAGPHDGLINIASGSDVSIRDLAETIARTIGYSGRLSFDPTKPEGAMRRSIDISRLTQMGWAPSMTLTDGIAIAYRAFLDESA